MKKDNKYIYKHLITKRYYTGGNDTNNINKAKMFNNYTYLVPFGGGLSYERILFEDALKKDKFNKLKYINENNKI